MAWNDGSNFVYGGMAAAMDGAAAQGNYLQGMMNNATGMIQRENDSRVAQMREMRRMEHEKELMRMQVEARRKEQEGDMIRQILASM